MENTKRPTITIPTYDLNAKDNKDNKYKPLVKLTKEDDIYLNTWREKASKLYKKHTGYYNKGDEQCLIDPDPFESKWYIFYIKPQSRKATPLISNKMHNSDYIEPDLVVKFELGP